MFGVIICFTEESTKLTCDKREKWKESNIFSGTVKHDEPAFETRNYFFIKFKQKNVLGTAIKEVIPSQLKKKR